jgi:RNA polymerase sigma-70 factor (ECF subfamily)
VSSDNKFVRSLIESAKLGNNAAIEQLFQMNLAKIYAFALRLTANKSLAETITKDTFIEAWKKINLVRSDASLLKWLNSITVYKTIEAFRSKKSKNKTDHQDLKELESKCELDKYLITLPDQERMTFVLNKVEGYTLEEISDMMGTKKDQVQAQLNIAIDKLTENIPSIKDENILIEKLAQLQPEIQPSAEVRDGIFSYIMDEKIREKRELEKIASALAEKEKRENQIDESEETNEFVPEPVVVKPKKDFSINFAVIKKILYGIIAVFVLIVAYMFITAPSGGWQIISMTGQPKLNNNDMSKNDDWSADDVIQTDENSSITFAIPKIGRLLIDPLTNISRTKNDQLKLETGQIKKFEGDATDVLTVITPLAKFTELYKGSAFRLSVAADEVSKLIVESGWIVVSVKEFDSYVPKNFGCLVMRGKYAMPYPLDTAPQLISLLENFSGVTDPTIGTVLSLATKKESLTLWHLLQLVSSENRFLVFDKLNELIPAPNGVTKAGIQGLNKDMLLNWRQEIELKMD